MITIKEVIVCEGKYDKIKLSQIFDTLIITTEGFRIYKDSEKIELLKRLEKEKGIIILTDSDSAGFRIRNRIIQCLGKSANVKNVYLPEIKGKEKRKEHFGAEGILGVEGIDDKTIIDAVLLQTKQTIPRTNPITKADLYEYGIVGGKESAKVRRLLADKLSLPQKLSSNSLLSVINIFYTKNEFEELLNKFSNTN